MQLGGLYTVHFVLSILTVVLPAFVRSRLKTIYYDEEKGREYLAFRLHAK